MVHFPNEIWLGVADYLELPVDVCTRKYETISKDERLTQQTLVSLCLVSKQLRAVFQPQLYRSFIKYSSVCARDRLLTADSEWLHKYYQRDERTYRATRKQTRLENFMLTIIRRPDLALMVKQLRVGSFNEISSLPVHLQKLYERLHPCRMTSTTLENALRTFQGFERLPHQIKRSWLEQLRDGEEGAEVALLLILLPSLHCLHINSPSGDLGSFIQELRDVILGPEPGSWILKSVRGKLLKYPVVMQSRSQQPPRILAALKSLSVWSACGHTISLQQCVDSLSLLPLKSFEGRGLGADYRPLRTTSDLTSLQHLKLLRCKIEGRALETFLSRCTRLRSLEINSDFAYDPEIETPFINDHFSDTLQKSAKTLERLTLSMPEYFYHMHLDMSSFEKLRYFEINFGLLYFNAELPYIHKGLPTSIQELIIRGVDIRIRRHLQELFDTFSPIPMFPTLATLKLYALQDEYNDLEKRLATMQEQAQQCQLEYTFEKEPDHKHRWFWWAIDSGDSNRY